ncbi:hypothetical protein [Fimbriiglobus ruber]|uniref:hypothetical protein n=1 Tax=Fimbriiglobus ruber TaxID=1908690 RepID=UPI00137B6C66|nr:hypothetical protein [Fimbriiglobus ruber]
MLRIAHFLYLSSSVGNPKSRSERSTTWSPTFEWLDFFQFADQATALAKRTPFLVVSRAIVQVRPDQMRAVVAEIPITGFVLPDREVAQDLGHPTAVAVRTKPAANKHGMLLVRMKYTSLGISKSPALPAFHDVT